MSLVVSTKPRYSWVASVVPIRLIAYLISPSVTVVVSVGIVNAAVYVFSSPSTGVGFTSTPAIVTFVVVDIATFVVNLTVTLSPTFTNFLSVTVPFSPSTYISGVPVTFGLFTKSSLAWLIASTALSNSYWISSIFDQFFCIIDCFF